MKAPIKWYEQGFALGAAGAAPGRRKGAPRLRAMARHWRLGIKHGNLARAAFVGAYTAELREPDPRLAGLFADLVTR